ncbi:hypothetical protein NC652_004346 [Populus alba x Populus x berolinensis]|nr:hypothetical protein NC652_004346 [Populus alba x Populus x berolinensis]
MSYKVGSALRFHGYDANSKVEVVSFIQISWLNAIREWQEEFVGNLNSSPKKTHRFTLFLQ